MNICEPQLSVHELGHHLVGAMTTPHATLHEVHLLHAANPSFSSIPLLRMAQTAAEEAVHGRQMPCHVRKAMRTYVTDLSFVRYITIYITSGRWGLRIVK